MTERYLCVHGHFYQPPRENPWLNAIECQTSAWPYHDWNHRITRECYGPNTRARIHGKDGRISELVNNYAHMSFDFGPTLLSWLEKAHPWIYSQILDADRISVERFEGHGNALAQVYNHIIMPLASRRDKLTQVRWGMADFSRRFGREPEGMWLSETAVDTETLSLLAMEGIRFTILSPSQAEAVRPLSGPGREGAWQEVTGERIDTTRPYRVLTGGDGGPFIDVFFYDGLISRAVAYERLLASGEAFLERIREAFGPPRDGPELVSLATDGESYGHHFKFGDLALAWLFRRLEKGDEIGLMNYGLFLDKFPPLEEVRIVENSSWSCAHGVERWRADCGCSVSRRPDWNQAWRAPLREGLDWLARELAGIFKERGARLFRDPHEARDEYIRVFPDPTKDARDAFLEDHGAGQPGPEEEIEAFQLLECQRMALYMFTSCGWFFDDISGLEPVQILKYAARAMDLARPWPAGKDLEAGLMEYLAKARSNLARYGDGKRIYDLKVRPSRVEPSRAVANHGLVRLAVKGRGSGEPFLETVRSRSEIPLGGDEEGALLGQAEVMEAGTGRKSLLPFVALGLKRGGWVSLVGEEGQGFDPDTLSGKIKNALSSSLEDAVAVFSAHVTGMRRYGPGDLIPDGARLIMKEMLLELDSLERGFLGSHDLLLDGLFPAPREEETEKPRAIVPEALLMRLLRFQLDRLFSADEKDAAACLSRLGCLSTLALSMKLVLNDRETRAKSEEFLAREMKSLASSFKAAPAARIMDFLDMADSMNLKPDLWECQNIFYDLSSEPELEHRLDPRVVATFRELGERLGFLMGSGATPST